MNQFPHDFPHALTGFGGDPALDRAQHRERRRKCPVILVHGNASHSAHPDYGMLAMRGFLKAAGYQDCEIWCCDYLGEDNTGMVLPDVHRDHIDAVRHFFDDVRDYLGVRRTDFIAHSLGCGMVNGWLRGLQANGEWNNADHRLAATGTFVGIAGAQYGLGSGFGKHEFTTGGAFEIASHRFGGVASDDTPSGEDEKARQQSPIEAWKQATALDDDKVTYVAIIARGDFVDQQHRDTSRREGADLNKVMDMGTGAAGHAKVIKDQTVFDAFKGYLNRYPPVPPVTFSVDKASGNHGPNLRVTLAVAPADATIAYVARRLTKAEEAGAIAEHVVQVLEGSLANGQSFTLEHDGAWDVHFTADSGATLDCTYGVNVLIPELAILTDNEPPFEGSLAVVTHASKGTVYCSSDRVRWLAEATPVIRETTTLHFIAIDADGLPSPVVSRAFEKQLVPFVKATLTEHFLAQRLDVDEYVALTLELGGNGVVILYFVGDEWVRDPGSPRIGRMPVQRAGAAGAAGAASARRMAAAGAGRLAIECDAPSGTYPHAFDAVIATTEETAVVHYTEDGSDPSDTRNPLRQAFTGSKRFGIRGNGAHALLCHAKNGAGNEAFAAFAWRIEDRDRSAVRLRAAPPVGL